MKKLLVLFLTVVSLSLHAQDVYKCSSCEVSFFSATAMEDIDAHNKDLSSFIKPSTNDVVFVIPVRNFNFGNALMQEHFNEKYMESDKYPNATFQGKLNETVDFTKDACYKVSATGTMKMHGVEKTITTPGTITVKQGEVRLEAEFKVALKDYNIEVPKLVVAKIAEEVDVKIDANYVPYKK